VLVDNGLIRLEVLEKKDAHIRCRVLTSGQLTSRRHINLPGVNVHLPAFTEKDRADTIVGLEEGIDLVALSFVRSATDIENLREFLRSRDSRARIIAKIEDQSAITNLDEIVQACDGLMVARGDLGIECPFEELPIIQRRAVRACLHHGRAVIIATHMLESMIQQPMPTRAEITDVANAVDERADCVMLSGETTVGRHPVECVQVLDKIARRTEQEEPDDVLDPVSLGGDKVKLLHSAVVMANELPGSLLLTFTRQGFMAQGHDPRLHALTRNPASAAFPARRRALSDGFLRRPGRDDRKRPPAAQAPRPDRRGRQAHRSSRTSFRRTASWTASSFAPCAKAGPRRQGHREIVN
jgi:pyruvate kinase